MDTALCTGCHACSVACKQWNGLEAEPQPNAAGPATPGLATFDPRDAAGGMSATNWRHVRFVGQGALPRVISDSCKHCAQAPCLEVCPTAAIVRTEYDSIFVRQELCNGCRACVPACPFGAVNYSQATGTVAKCTLCYDRLQVGLAPACAQACPTRALVAGPLAQLRAYAAQRLSAVRTSGEAAAQLYGQDSAEEPPLGGLNAFYLLLSTPETYGLPRAPQRPSRSLLPAWLAAATSAAAAALGSLIALRQRGALDDHS